MLTTTQISEEELRIVRNTYIDGILRSHPGMTYVEQLSRAQMRRRFHNALPLLDSKLNGREVVVEYHLFLTHGDLSVVTQWRHCKRQK
jgi:hypothetical protein